LSCVKEIFYILYNKKVQAEALVFGEKENRE